MKKIRVLFILMFVAVLTIGCSSTDSGTKNTNDSTDSANVFTGGDIRIAIDAQPPTLDPKTQRHYNNDSNKRNC